MQQMIYMQVLRKLLSFTRTFKIVLLNTFFKLWKFYEIAVAETIIFTLYCLCG